MTNIDHRVSDDGEGKDAFLSTKRLQMQHAVLDLLRAALIPELGGVYCENFCILNPVI